MVNKPVFGDTITGVLPTVVLNWLKTIFSPLRLTINAQTGTSYGLVLADESKLITLTNGSPILVTIPTNASQAFPVGTQVHFAQRGSGQVTFVGAGGVTVNGSPGLKLDGIHAGATAIQVAANTWWLTGKLAA